MTANQTIAPYGLEITWMCRGCMKRHVMKYDSDEVLMATLECPCGVGDGNNLTERFIAYSIATNEYKLVQRGQLELINGSPRPA